MNEERRPADGTNGRYTVNRLGEIFNAKTGRKLKFKTNGDGYLIITFCINKVPHSIRAHRVVATAYKPNPNHLPEVNHINGDKTDNRPENLEWCDRRHNELHAYRFLHKQPDVTPKRVKGIHIQSGIIIWMPTLSAAARLVHGKVTRITEVCRGKYSQHKGWRWSYF